MIYLIIGVIIAYVVYQGMKGNADMENVNKYGGLKIKYSTLIDRIMSRNSYYQMIEVNSNDIRLTCTGMVFRLTEIDKKIQIVWNWESFSTSKIHKLIWNFDEWQDQDMMYEIIDKDIKVQCYIDDGMTKQQAEDFYKIRYANNEEEQERLIKDFSNKYPSLWAKITGQ